MDYLVIILPKLVSFLLLILLGFCAARFGAVKREGLPSISGLMLKVALPCLTISLMEQRGTTFADLLSFHRIILWQLLGYLVLAAFGLLAARLTGLRFPESNVHAGCMVGGNYAFVVIPMIMALYPADGGQEYIPICSAVDTLVVWTLGLHLFTRGADRRNEPFWKPLLRQLTHPIMLSIVGMLIFNSLRLTLPGAVSDLCSQVGNVCYTVGLIYIGCNMCFLKKASLGLLRHVCLIPLTKLLLVPLLLYWVSSHFLPQTESVILMLIMGAPTMTTSVMIAEEHRLNADYAATAVFLTTLSCLITIPLLFLLISFL